MATVCIVLYLELRKCMYVNLVCISFILTLIMCIYFTTNPLAVTTVTETTTSKVIKTTEPASTDHSTPSSSVATTQTSRPTTPPLPPTVIINPSTEPSTSTTQRVSQHRLSKQLFLPSLTSPRLFLEASSRKESLSRNHFKRN